MHCNSSVFPLSTCISQWQVLDNWYWYLINGDHIGPKNVLHFRYINTKVSTCRLGGVQPVWNWDGKVRHLHDPRLVWKQVLHGNCRQEIWREPSSFSDGWEQCFHLKQSDHFTVVNPLTLCFHCVRCVGQRLLHSVQQSAGSQRHSWWQHHGGGVR